MPEEWKFLRRHSPYQMLRHDCLGLPDPDSDILPSPRSDADGAAGWICPKVLCLGIADGHVRAPASASPMAMSSAPEQTVPVLVLTASTRVFQRYATHTKRRSVRMSVHMSMHMSVHMPVRMSLHMSMCTVRQHACRLILATCCFRSRRRPIGHGQPWIPSTLTRRPSALSVPPYRAPCPDLQGLPCTDR